jgi:anti-anti-sigma factor
MVAIAWVDTPEGRRWYVRRGVFFLFLGTIPFIVGRTIGEPLLKWLGGGFFAFGTWNIVLPFVHIGRGMEDLEQLRDTDPTPQPVDHRNEVAPTKPCVVPGCTGTMVFHKRLHYADAPHTLEWPWYPTWQCLQDSAHIQVASRAEVREIVRKLMTDRARGARKVAQRVVHDSRTVRVAERTVRLDECGGEGFEPYVEPCFYDLLDNELLAAKEISHVVVLDVVGALEGYQAQEFDGLIARLVERGERIIVVNLEGLTRLDSAGLGVLVRSYGTLKRSGRSMPIVNAPTRFRQFVASMKFL